MNFSCLHPRDQIVATMERIYGRSMTTTSGGNISIHDENGDKWMTPARVDKGSLRRQDIVRIGRDGACEAVVNALPVFATAFCVSDFLLDTRTIPESYLFLKDVGTIAFEHQFGDGAKVAKALRPVNPVALLRHNGVMVAGRTILDAFDRLEVLEATAAAIIQSRPLGSICPMSDEVTRDLLAAFPGL